MHWHSITLIMVFAALPLQAAELTDLLHNLSRSHDLEIYVEEGLEHEEAGSIPDDACSLEEILRRSLRGYSHALRYAGETPVELRVFVSGTGAMNRLNARHSASARLAGPVIPDSPVSDAAITSHAPGNPPSAAPGLHRPHGPPTGPDVRRTASGYAYRNTSLGRMPVRTTFPRPAPSLRRHSAPASPVSQSNNLTTEDRRQEELLTRSAMLREFTLQARTKE